MPEIAKINGTNTVILCKTVRLTQDSDSGNNTNNFQQYQGIGKRIKKLSFIEKMSEVNVSRNCQRKLTAIERDRARSDRDR